MQVKKGKKGTLKKAWHARYLYIMLLPFFAWLIVFHYGPMYGIQLAFKKYTARLGIWGSPWVGMANFKRIFITPIAVKAIRNTVLISLARIALGFPAPIVLAILINEMRGRRLKKAYQTIFTFPHFLSWIVMGAIIRNFFSYSGAINTLIENLGFERQNFLTNGPTFLGIILGSGVWAGVGWGSIIYLATISGIDPTLYDAAKVDGASHWRQIWHITLPGIRTTIAILFVLDMGGIMNAGFDQIFNMRNGAVSEYVTIIDTYVYDITFGSRPNYGFSTAVGLFKSVINFILVLSMNKLVKKITGVNLYM